MRSFRRSARHDQLVEQLAGANHKSSGQPIFQYIRDLLCFAAALGYESNRSQELKEPLVPFVDSRNFENVQQAVELFYLIGLATSKNVNALKPDAEDELVTIFEKCADGGLDELKQWLIETPSDPLGDKAILEALARHGFLKQTNKPPDVVAAEVDF